MKNKFKFFVFIYLILSFSILDAKVVNVTSTTDIKKNLDIIYNTFENGDTYITDTNKFNCNSDGCIASDYEKIGLFSIYEYNRVNYLIIDDSWFGLDNNAIKNVKSNGIEDVTSESGLRPSVNIKSGTRVSGSGTYKDPWMIIMDIEPTKYYNINLEVINGSSNNYSLSVVSGKDAIFSITPNEDYALSNKSGALVCNNSNKEFTTDSEGNIKISNITEDMNCKLTLYRSKFMVSINVVNGSASPSNQKVDSGGEFKTKITPNSDYSFTNSSKLVCNNSSKTFTIESNNELKITNINEDLNCTLTLERTVYTVKLTVNNGTSDKSEVKVTSSEPALFKVTPNSGYKIDNTLGNLKCDGVNKDFTTDSEGNIKISNITKDTSCVLNLVVKQLTFKETILNDNKGRATRSNFDLSFTKTTTGTLYTTNETEDNVTVYYYSGNVTNNWVKFGGFYWRIIRTNEDDSVRLLYAGTSHTTTDAVLSQKSYYNSAFDVGYMIKNNISDSEQKEYIDNWYKNNLLASYDKYVSKTAIYCNDRSGTQSGSSVNWAPYIRLSSTFTPSYKCGGDGKGGMFGTTQRLADKFSVSTSSGGNGLLTYPVAAMTADEVAFAGGAYWEELSSPYAWYYTNSLGQSITNDEGWWTMSPCNVSGNYFVFLVNKDEKPGYLWEYNPGQLYYYRPVISIKSCATVASGNGNPNTPYTLNVDSQCAKAEN